MIKCFVINLKRRKDRLKKISSHLDSNGLKFIKFEAIDAEKSSYSLLNKNIAQGGGPLGNIPSISKSPKIASLARDNLTTLVVSV